MRVVFTDQHCDYRQHVNPDDVVVPLTIINLPKLADIYDDKEIDVVIITSDILEKGIAFFVPFDATIIFDASFPHYLIGDIANRVAYAREQRAHENAVVEGILLNQEWKTTVDGNGNKTFGEGVLIREVVQYVMEVIEKFNEDEEEEGIEVDGTGA